MATPNLYRTIQPGDPDDPFRYGWRYLHRVRPDGTAERERVPLTLADVLHPQEDDFIVQNSAHQRLQMYLCAVFSAQLADDPTAVILADVRIAWDVPGLEAHGPDVAVITGVREKKTWGTFDVATEGVRPALLVEITSPSTVGIDFAEKREEYEIAAVPTYVIIDLIERRGAISPRLIGYTLEPAGYRQIAPDERGWLWLEAVRAWLGVLDGQVVCFDKDGQPLGDYVAVSAALRAETERTAVLEAQVRELQAELDRLRRTQ